MWALAQQNYFLDLAKASGNSRRNCLIGILFFNFNSCIFYINASVFFELPPALAGGLQLGCYVGFSPTKLLFRFD